MGRKIKLEGKQFVHRDNADQVYTIKRKDGSYQACTTINHKPHCFSYSEQAIRNFIDNGIWLLYTPAPKLKNQTWKDYEDYLNDLYADEYDGDWERVKEDFARLGLPDSALWKAYENRQLGTRVRKYDSIGFYAGYNDWVAGK